MATMGTRAPWLLLADERAHVHALQPRQVHRHHHHVRVVGDEVLHRRHRVRHRAHGVPGLGQQPGEVLQRGGVVSARRSVFKGGELHHSATPLRLSERPRLA